MMRRLILAAVLGLLCHLQFIAFAQANDDDENRSFKKMVDKEYGKMCQAELQFRLRSIQIWIMRHFAQAGGWIVCEDLNNAPAPSGIGLFDQIPTEWAQQILSSWAGINLIDVRSHLTTVPQFQWLLSAVNINPAWTLPKDGKHRSLRVIAMWLRRERAPELIKAALQRMPDPHTAHSECVAMLSKKHAPPGQNMNLPQIGNGPAAPAPSSTAAFGQGGMFASATFGTSSAAGNNTTTANFHFGGSAAQMQADGGGSGAPAGTVPRYDPFTGTTSHVTPGGASSWQRPPPPAAFAQNPTSHSCSSAASSAGAAIPLPAGPFGADPNASGTDADPLGNGPLGGGEESGSEGGGGDDDDTAKPPAKKRAKTSAKQKAAAKEKAAAKAKPAAKGKAKAEAKEEAATPKEAGKAKAKGKAKADPKESPKAGPKNSMKMARYR
eukprot:CAMPEP_0178991802 /NCGR_PEP_ID=MMETSP0795-20121207/5742_1 /TAXON_ID=88552 /ORGANISM="Amoebophrya sp., Strain Ameob2" /LENGTH=437 /DNA_ID=CAMNT_0020683575 /DNA_START=1587 /DNA_END=2900 /DNA_ORIENTATION=+